MEEPRKVSFCAVISCFCDSFSGTFPSLSQNAKTVACNLRKKEEKSWKLPFACLSLQQKQQTTGNLSQYEPF
jgi:hypothetical protein